MNMSAQYNKVTRYLIDICKQKTFSSVSSINSNQTDKALPVKASKPNLVTFFLYFGNSLFDYLWNFFVRYGGKRETIFLVTYATVWRCSLGGAGGESVNSTGCPDFK